MQEETSPELALINDYFELLSQGDASALRYFHRDATFHWEGRDPVSGKLKIGSEIRLVPLFTYSLSTLDCQNSEAVPYVIIVATGMIRFGSQQAQRFHSSFYMNIEGPEPLIMYQTMKIM